MGEDFNKCYDAACRRMNEQAEGKLKHLRFYNFKFFISDFSFDINMDKLKLWAVFNIERKKKMMIKKYYQGVINELKLNPGKDFLYETTTNQRSNNKKYSICMEFCRLNDGVLTFHFKQTRLFPTFYLDLIIIQKLVKEFEFIKQVVIEAESVNLLFEAPLLYQFTNKTLNFQIKEAHDSLLEHWKTKNLNWQSEIRIHRAYYSGIKGKAEFN